MERLPAMDKVRSFTDPCSWALHSKTSFNFKARLDVSFNFVADFLDETSCLLVERCSAAAPVSPHSPSAACAGHGSSSSLTSCSP